MDVLMRFRFFFFSSRRRHTRFKCDWSSDVCSSDLKELSGYFAKPEVRAKLNDEISAVPEPERRAFLLANLVAEQLTFRLFKKFVQQISGGNVVESMQALSAIAPILVILTPYLYGLH